MTERGHRAWLEFVRKAMELPIEYSASDLARFRRVAQEQYPALVRVIESYIQLIRQSAEESGSLGAPSPSVTPPDVKEARRARAKLPLFDLLRDRRLFPTNLDIARFAQRVVPNMRTYRFDKMSKGDIALRIIEYLETLNSKTRAKLEASMREALEMAPEQDTDRRSFMSKWEDIIKDIEIGS